MYKPAGGVACVSRNSHPTINFLGPHPTGTVARVVEPDALLSDLDAHQRAAVTEPHTPLANLHLSLAQKFGCEIDSFNGVSTGALSSIG